MSASAPFDLDGTWEWSTEEIRRVGYRVVDLIAEHLTGLPAGPAFQPVPPETIAGFLDGAPLAEEGVSADVLLDDFAARIAPYPFGNGHPRFFGWINSPPAMMGIFADALAAALNPSCAGGNHAAIYVEHQVLNWFKQLVGFPPESGGLLVSGGSMATLTALAVARHVKAGGDVRALGLRGLPGQLVVYVSEDGHGAVRKSSELLGIGNAGLRIIPVDELHRLRVDALEAAIVADRVAGECPIAVVASAGTASTGAIDPLAEVAAVCRRHDLWFHIDGAYGAPAILSGRYRDELAALALADSLGLDPHKWLYVPVEAGLVLVRDAAALRAAFSLVPPYLPVGDTPTGVTGLPWFSEYGFQQSRGFRALKVWMALRHHGIAGYTAAIEHDLALAGYLVAQVEAAPDLALAAPPSLSIVCFRYVPSSGDAVDLDALNRKVLEEVQFGGRAFLSGTVLGGCFALRVCVVNHRSRVADIDALVAVVREVGAWLASAW
jgi:aromatic-L-amino-acid decarboxylase